MLPQYPGPPLTRLRSLLPQLGGVKQTAYTAIRTLDKDTSGPAKEVASKLAAFEIYKQKKVQVKPAYLKLIKSNAINEQES